MSLLWLATLLLLHQGYSLVPVITVELGQTVTLTCAFSLKYQNNKWIFWYKQSAGDTLDLIVMQQRTTNPNYGPAFSASKFSVTNYSSLTIFTTVRQDEGMYHCAQMDALDFMWSGTYVFIKGIPKRTSNYTVFSQPTISDPTGSETLQCSVLSDSETTTCSGEPRVFWFRAGSEKSFPTMIHTAGQKAENCEKRSASPKKCFYNFSKNISSSDTGTYYCAVAICGQILFGNEINQGNGKTNENNMLVVTIICLVISVIGNIVFICYLTQRSACQQCKENSSQKRNDFSQVVNDTEAGPDLNYAALHFSEGRTSRGKKKRELMTEESVYSQVKGSA
ncbi:signal-regulatory protein beta-2-like [Poeciliopsis prolifica]|uniref:signal-regulatory protein beta-2-like n=1 Tax=Poeciliopsis prolifica TaxID=188132 RepID=UPI0024142554|nr:signal-regulatory protein beta-2-like [Poeciliopsis prolifica]